MGIPRFARISISKEFVSRRMDSFDVIMRKSCANLRCRLHKSDNKLVKTVLESNFFMFSSKINMMWRKHILQFKTMLVIL